MTGLGAGGGGGATGAGSSSSLHACKPNIAVAINNVEFIFS